MRTEVIELTWFRVADLVPPLNTTIIINDLNYGCYVVCTRVTEHHYESLDGSNDDFSFNEWAIYPF